MRMRFGSSITLCVAITQVWLGVGYSRLVGIPTEPFDESGGSYSLDELKSIVVDQQYFDAKDNDGQTLIPPTLESFARTFSEDLKSSLGFNIPVETGKKGGKDSIFLTLGNADNFKDIAGRKTSEGYKLDVTAEGITVSGASPLGAWWGTRTILQQAVLGDSQLPHGSGSNSPGWGSRGCMLDVARHYYPPEFLVEMCSYLSFFKQNVFHVHVSDNLIYQPDYYETDGSQYSSFRLNSDDPTVTGLSHRTNESYYEEDWENIQRKCADRGVTIIPEIEAPAHALVITEWKPELALETDKHMLNLSHPDTLPTMETIWKVFLPWFHAKTVHIGADEYDRGLVDDYMGFVNAMNDFIQAESGKSVRVWGTFAPSLSENVTVHKNVSIQHWEGSMATPYSDFIQNGHNVLNSDSFFYLVPKHDAYPTTYPVSQVFNGNPDGGPYAPNILDAKISSNNPPKDHPSILGHVAALWNDNGPNGTSYSEPYYAWRYILPALADKQWNGDLIESEFNKVFEKLHAAIPAQNLDRAIDSKTDVILQYQFEKSAEKVADGSGNNYNGQVKGGCSIDSSSITFGKGCYLETPLSSKGRNYTLSFSVKQTSNQPSVLVSGRDSILRSGNGTSSYMMLINAGNAFAVDYSLPLNEWRDVSLIGRGEQTFLSVFDGQQTITKEFFTELGLSAEQGPRNASIAIEAPLAKFGEGFEGAMKNITLLGCA